eukprot:snap_masked-scaffold_41-processed-gene-2.45-mRNA-1 protein AED:1.00 eAED:1.00 QI:0/0/0/0/1/1/2/0/84
MSKAEEKPLNSASQIYKSRNILDKQTFLAKVKIRLMDTDYLLTSNIFDNESTLLLVCTILKHNIASAKRKSSSTLTEPITVRQL